MTAQHRNRGRTACSYSSIVHTDSLASKTFCLVTEQVCYSIGCRLGLGTPKHTKRLIRRFDLHFAT